MRWVRLVVMVAVWELVRPVIRSALTVILQAHWAGEADPSPWTVLRCGACRGVGTVHVCEGRRGDDEFGISGGAGVLAGRV